MSGTIGPQSGRQTSFLATPADIAIYGGAAGGGKTWALLLEPLRHVHTKGFGAVIFRRTYKQVTQEGGMWDESHTLYLPMGAEPRVGSLTWRFPSKVKVSFAYLNHEDDKHNYQGAQIALLAFDQLEHFSETQFFYMLSRNRSVCGVKPYVRATCNPDAESWLAELLAWWIDPDTGYAIEERGGAIRYMVRSEGTIIWADTPEELEEKYPHLTEGVRPKSVTFIPASVYDNKILLEKDPQYLANLLALNLIDMERLLKGNWKIRPAAGKVFDRAWFEIVDVAPAGGVVCRFWDFAATKKKLKGSDPDFTAGVRMRAVDGAYYIEDCIDVQEDTAEVDRMWRNIGYQDMAEANVTGASYRLRFEKEGGASGKRDAHRLVSMVPGIDVEGVPPQGDKLTRAKPLAAQSKAGNVKLVRGEWNERWLKHMHHQPDWSHDDIMDASSGSFNALVDKRWREVEFLRI